jgi:hemoglobin
MEAFVAAQHQCNAAVYRVAMDWQPLPHDYLRSMDPDPHPQITEAALARLVDVFYGKVRRDPLIGPIFNGAVHDWDEHLVKLAGFWSSVMLTTGRYKGNPFSAHQKHQLTPQMFERWLALWDETTGELFEPDAAAQLRAKANRIGASLQQGLFFRPAVDA